MPVLPEELGQIVLPSLLAHKAMPKQDSTQVPPSLEVAQQNVLDSVWARSDDAQSVQPHYNADPNEVDSLAKDLHGSLQEGEAGKFSIYQKKSTHCESNPSSKRLRPTAEPWHPPYAFSSNDAIASGMPKFSTLSQNQRLRPTAAIFTPSQMKTSAFDAFPKSAQNEYAWKKRHCQVPSAASSSGTKELRQAAAEFVPINHDAFQPQSPELTFAFPPAGAYQDSDYHHHAFPMSSVSGQEPSSSTGSFAFTFEMPRSKLPSYSPPLIRESSALGMPKIRVTTPLFVPSDLCSSIRSSPAFRSSGDLPASPLVSAIKIRANAAAFVPVSTVAIRNTSPASSSDITSSGMRPVTHSVHNADVSASTAVINNDDQHLCDLGGHEGEATKIRDCKGSTHAQILGQTNGSRQTSLGLSPSTAIIITLSEAAEPPSKVRQSTLDISQMEVEETVIQGEADELLNRETGLLESTMRIFRREASPTPSMDVESFIDLSASIQEVSRGVATTLWLISNDFVILSERSW